MNKSPHEKISDLLTTIGNPVRIQILLAIGTGEACVCHLEALLLLRQANISQQLMILREKKVITSRREGKYIYYRLVEPNMLDILRIAGQLAGLTEGAIIIQDHSKCECPKCNAENNLISADLPAGGIA